MKKILHVHNVNDYVRYIGAPVLDTAGNIIRRFVMSQAQKLLISGMSITSTANKLGFEYPQHFTRMFKKHFGQSPSQYVNRRNKTRNHSLLQESTS